MSGKVKPLALFLCLACLAAASARAADDYPVGKVLQYQTMPSKILNQDVRYTIYLPPGYGESERDYPVFYMLHGGGSGDDREWVQFGEIDKIMDKGIADGSITPMIIVTPNNNRNPQHYPSIYYMNDADGKYMWADMFVQEFIPYIEGKYKVRPDRRIRGIGGLSMGGYGALMYTFKHPGMFQACLAISSGIYNRDQILAFKPYDYERRYGAGFGGHGLEGEARFTEQYYKQHPIGMLRDIKVDDLKKVKFFIECGSDDRFDVGNHEIHNFMKKNGVKHHFQLLEGKHDWYFFKASAERGLKHLSYAFNTWE